MIIDSHQHFWQKERGDYTWLTPNLGPLYRDFMPLDLKPILDKHQVSGTVLIQAAPTEAETIFLLNLAKETDFVKGVVGWVDMQSPNVASRLEILIDQGDGYLKGIRPMIQDIPDPGWILSPKLNTAFQVLEKYDLSFDALVKPTHLEALQKCLAVHPGLRVVIDHAAKPDIADGGRSKWSQDLAELAKFPNVYCKLSGLLTEAGANWKAEDIRPFMHDVFHFFGSKRIMWGSDWPVLTLAGEYGEWLSIISEFIIDLSRTEQSQILGDTARHFYKLDMGKPTI